MVIYYFLKKYLVKYKKRIVCFVFLYILTGLLSAAIPLITGNFIDSLIDAGSIKIIIKFCFTILFLYFIRKIMEYASSLIYIAVQTKTAYELNRDTLSHMQKVSLSFTDNKDTVYLNQMINNDSNAIVIFVLTTIQEFFINGINFLIPLLLTIAINYKITAFLFIFIGLYIVIYQILKGRLYRWSFKLNECKSQFFSKLQEQLTYIKFIKTNSLQNEIHSRLNFIFDQLLSTAIKYQKVNFLFSSLNELITVLGQVCIYAFGGLQIIQGSFSIGMFTIFISYFNIMLSSVKYFYGFGKRYQDVYVSYKRLMEIWNEKEETDGNTTLSYINNIKVNSLKFAYQNGNPICFPDFNFYRGNIYAVTGENGKGKSTFITLLTGLYCGETSGAIYYNNHSINELNMSCIRKELIAISDQHPILINDTVRYNLTLTESKNASIDERILQLSKVLNFDEFIENIDGNLDYIINNSTSNLSGGEKQKISILRVLLKNPQVMIFDEPTSFIDSKSVSSFVDYLLKVKDDKIIIIITHDNRLTKICNKIYEL